MCNEIKLRSKTNVSRNFASPLYYKHRKVAHRRVQWRGTTWEYLSFTKYFTCQFKGNLRSLTEYFRKKESDMTYACFE